MNVRQWGVAALTVAVCAAALVVSAADVLKQIGLTEADARRATLDSFTQGYVPIYPASKAIKAATPAVRVTLITGVLTFVKAYTETPEFAQAFQKVREEAKPQARAVKSGDEEYAKMLKETETSIADMKKSAADPAQKPEMKKMLEQMVQTQVQQYEKMKADPKMKEIFTMSAEAENKSNAEQHQARLKEWETRYPADPKVAVARHLRKFLDVSATVDYGAQLTARGPRQVFVNPKYEQESSDWKLCYRTGKETVNAARAFVTTWLTALPR